MKHAALQHYRGLNLFPLRTFDMKFRIDTVVTFRYCNLTEEDPNFGGYKVTAEIPRDVFNNMAEGIG